MKIPMGLTASEVEESRKKYGSNSIPDSKPTTFWDEFKETFSDPMIKILLVVAAVMIGMFFIGYSDIYEPIGTIIAVLLVATISAKTNVSSDSKYRQLKNSAPKPTCKVYRNDELQVIHMDDVVVGDLVLLQSGDKIPADGMLIDGKLKVNNSVLNGEAEECKKIPASNTYKFPDEITGDTFVDDSSLFREAIIYDGEGIMKVQKTGLKTMMGRMAEEIRNRSIPDSPLKVKLAKLANQISMFGYIGAAVITVLYVLYSIVTVGGPAAFMDMGLQYVIQSIMRAISLAVVIIVCAVPEGLPLMIALVLMQNTGKMMDHNVLVRKAIGIETAGSLNILFSDKTGTITKGELEVVEFFTGDSTTLTGESLQSASDIQSMLQIAIADNTNSAFDSEHKVVGGNATDQALMRYIGEACFNRVRSEHSVTDTQGFNSTNKFSQSYIGSLGRTVYKGAPEKLVAAATKYLSADGSLKTIDKQKLNRKIDEMAEKAMRVLAFGYSEQRLVQNKIHDDMILIGLVAIRDDVRPEAREAIKEVQDAGIQICMITGDRLETAVAIAKDSGVIRTNEDYRALSSAELNQMSDDEVKSIIPKLRVVARALPTDKSRLVRLCQEMNLVTGMTGRHHCPVLQRCSA